MKVKIRYEKEQSSLRFVDRFEEFEITEVEAEAVVRRDFEVRRATADEPELVEYRDFELIIREDINKPEYNRAKSWSRNTTYREVSLRKGEDTLNIVEATIDQDGHWEALTDPFDDLVTLMDLRAALDRLSERERRVLLLYADGYSVTEIAAQSDVSQPMISRVLHRAQDKVRRFMEGK